MKFGFDIDDTLINLREYAFHIYNRKLDQQISLEAYHALNNLEIHSIFGLTKEQGHEMWKQSMEEIYFTDCPIFERALDVMNELVAEGHEVFYITSRPKHFCSQSREWMVAQGFPVAEGHFFCGMEDYEKVGIIESLQLDYYVDDKPIVLETLHATSTKVIVKDQSYNKHIQLTRLKNWSEFKSLIAQ